jgi:hypothetical protein
MQQQAKIMEHVRTAAKLQDRTTWPPVQKADRDAEGQPWLMHLLMCCIMHLQFI